MPATTEQIADYVVNLRRTRTTAGWWPKALTPASEDAAYAAVSSTGVFTEGHAPASSLDDLVRIVRPGGFVIFTVRDSVLETGGFRAKFAELERSGRWMKVEESPSFRAFAVAEPEVTVKAFVFRIP